MILSLLVKTAYKRTMLTSEVVHSYDSDPSFWETCRTHYINSHCFLYRHSATQLPGSLSVIKHYLFLLCSAEPNCGSLKSTIRFQQTEDQTYKGNFQKSYSICWFLRKNVTIMSHRKYECN